MTSNESLIIVGSRESGGEEEQAVRTDKSRGVPVKRNRERTEAGRRCEFKGWGFYS